MNRLTILLLPFLVFTCQNPVKCADISINGIFFQVEIAQTPQQRELGLMHRKSLEDQTGMLFVYSQDKKVAYWMKDTSIPLSIAFIAKNGVIKEIHKMTPFSEKVIKSNEAIRYALELKQGEFVKFNIHAGDRVLFHTRF